MNKNYILISLCLLVSCVAVGQKGSKFSTVLSSSTIASESGQSRKSAIQWPWRVARNSYLGWWSEKVGYRIIEGFRIRPGVRYIYQQSTLEYIADEAVLGGSIMIDDDLLNAVNFPGVVESRLRNINLTLASGLLSRNVQNWTSMAQVNIDVVGVTVRGSYWSGALAPGSFPQPGDVGKLFKPEELIGVAAQEIAATSALNNAVSLEVYFHPLQLLTGFRKFEWSGESGFYIGADFAIGLVKTTDLTFKQGRELLGDLDIGEEIRNVLPNAVESLIDTDAAGDLLLDAIESRLPLYGFGLPIADGRTTEWKGWLGYQWTNKTWSGDVMIACTWQSQRLSNDHAATPTLIVKRIIPMIHAKWVFNKEETESSVFHR